VEDLYKKHQIEILVSVIQTEGSAKSAVLNCISLALVDAGICMKDLVVSCTVGTLQGLTVVDTNEEEEYELANEFVVSYLQDSGTLDCVSLRKAKVTPGERAFPASLASWSVHASWRVCCGCLASSWEWQNLPLHHRIDEAGCVGVLGHRSSEAFLVGFLIGRGEGDGRLLRRPVDGLEELHEALL
jgi:hypothetical protein